MFVVMINPDPGLFSTLSSNGVAVFTLDQTTAQSITDLDQFLQSYSVPSGTLVINQSKTHFSSTRYKMLSTHDPARALITGCVMIAKPFVESTLVFNTTQGYNAHGQSGIKSAHNGTLKTVIQGISKPIKTSALVAEQLGVHHSKIWITNTILNSIEDLLVVEMIVDNIKLSDAVARLEKSAGVNVRVSPSAIEIDPSQTAVYASKRYNSVVFTLVSSTTALTVSEILSLAAC